MAVLEKASLFDPKLVNDLITKVKGHSSLARLSKRIPVAFNGNKEFTFAMDSDIDIVAESGNKSNGGATVTPVTIVPIKFVYGMRVSDEFMYAAEEEQLNVMEAFNDGFAKKIAVGLDKAAMHGINPATGVISSVIGTNYLDSKVTQTVAYSASTIDANIESAISVVEANGEVTGIILSTTARGALAAMTDTNGYKLYPEFAFGGKPEQLGNNALDINATVSAPVKATSGADAEVIDHAIVGDFENMFHWGYAKEIPTEIIQYGDPDGQGDLKRKNQVFIRAEVYLGWGILDADSFARVTATEAD